MNDHPHTDELSWEHTLALIPYFAGERTFTEAKAELGLDVAQIREALGFLAQLELPGVPGRAAFRVKTAGNAGQVTPAAGLLARPLRLTADELSAMLLTLETLEASPMQRDADVVRSAAAKLRGAEPGRSTVADTIPRTAVDSRQAEILATVRSALADNRVVELEYRSAAGERTVRRVDPVSLFMVEDDPYLRAVDRPDGETGEEEGVVKSFRVDRMLGATVTDQAARKHDVPDFSADDPHGFLGGTKRWAKVTVDADSTWVADYDPVAWDSVPGDDDFPDGGPYAAWVPVNNPRRTVGFLLRRWPGVKAVEPVSLSKAVAERARAGLRAYGEAPTNG